MQASLCDALLDDAVAEVLEAMCFLSAEAAAGSADAMPDPSDPSDPSDPWLGKQLRFTGAQSGRFGIRAPLSTANIVACNFLGEEPEQLGSSRRGEAGEILGEIANMVCGTLLARIDAKSAFALSPPVDERSCDGGETRAASDLATRLTRSFRLDEGVLIAWLEMDPDR